VSAVAEDKPTKSRKRRKPLGPEPLVVRCMVFQERPGEYTAECIDLDIMARGKNPGEAFDRLVEAVTGYLAVATKGDCDGLVPRPAPVSHRARYHLFALRAAFDFGLVSRKRNFLLSDWCPSKSCWC
jgi:hypothetical protein